MISRVNHHQKMSFSKCMSGDIFLLILLVAADQERTTIGFADSWRT